MCSISSSFSDEDGEEKNEDLEKGGAKGGHKKNKKDEVAKLTSNLINCSGKVCFFFVFFTLILQ